MSQKKVLLIEDDDDDQEILLLCKAILAKSGFRIETLSRCTNVISEVMQINPDLILMDLWIPEIGGENAISILKEAVSYTHLTDSGCNKVLQVSNLLQ